MASIQSPTVDGALTQVDFSTSEGRVLGDEQTPQTIREEQQSNSSPFFGLPSKDDQLARHTPSDREAEVSNMLIMKTPYGQYQ